MKLIKIDSQEWYAQLELVKSKLDRFRRIDFMDFFAVKAIYGIRCDLERLGVTLEYIGTDEGELERLRINGCRFRAKNALEALRHFYGRGVSQFWDFYYFRKDIENGCLNLKDIGCSKKEYIMFWFSYFFDPLRRSAEYLAL